MLQQFEAAHSRQIRINHQTSLGAWMIGFEEGLAGRKILDGASVGLEHLAESVADMTIVVDNKDDLLEIVGRFSGEPNWRQMPCDPRRGQKALDGLGELLQPHGLVEVNAVVTRNIAQRACRYVASQDDGRDPTLKLRAQLLDNLESIQTFRQIVVCENEIRPDLAARDEIKRGDSVPRRRGMAALVLEQEIEQITYFGIVLDDQDGACALHHFGHRPFEVQLTFLHWYGGCT